MKKNLPYLIYYYVISYKIFLSQQIIYFTTTNIFHISIGTYKLFHEAKEEFYTKNQSFFCYLVCVINVL